MLKKMLYPVGKCHARYGSYIAWSFISTVIVSVESALASHSMLAVLGQQSELHRTFNYVGKDIVGQIGALGYISKTSFKADKEPYKFLQYSHIVQQISYVSMFCTPLASSLFLPIAGCSNILTNISFAGLGAINARCIQILAIDDNIGEIYAKVSMINMIGSSIGLAIGVAISAVVPDHTTRVCLTPLMAICRVYSFNHAVKIILNDNK